MSLVRIHLEILKYLFDNIPQDESYLGDISRKIMFKSINFRSKQIEKASKELEEKGYVRLYSGFYKNEWSSISITDHGMDYLEKYRK